MQKRQLNQIIDLPQCLQRRNLGKRNLNNLKTANKMRIMLRYCLNKFEKLELEELEKLAESDQLNGSENDSWMRWSYVVMPSSCCQILIANLQIALDTTAISQQASPPSSDPALDDYFPTSKPKSMAAHYY